MTPVTTGDDPERRHPDDHAFTPEAGSLRRIEKGALFCRVYNHVAAARASPPYFANSFNPFPVKADEPDVRGRYSSTKAFEFDYLYVAELKDAEQVAILETVDYKIRPLGSTPDAFFLTKGDVDSLSVAYFELTRDLFLVDFTTRPKARNLYHVSQPTVEGSDFRLTRRWARWIREVVPDADGIMYRSNRYGSEAAGFPIVLFAPHRTGLCAYLAPYSAEVQLGTDEGRELLDSIQGDTYMPPDASWT